MLWPGGGGERRTWRDDGPDRGRSTGGPGHPRQRTENALRHGRALPIETALALLYFTQTNTRACSVCVGGGVVVTQLCPTLCDPMDWSLPDSSVHTILTHL